MHDLPETFWLVTCSSYDALRCQNEFLLSNDVLSLVYGLEKLEPIEVYIHLKEYQWMWENRFVDHRIML